MNNYNNMEHFMRVFDARVANWNHLRYAREFNTSLSLSLIHEEMQELLNAKTLGDQLDAIGDICFVASGIAWRLGAKGQEFTCEQAMVWGIVEKSVAYVNDIFASYGVPLDLFCEILLAICDSNDTKVAIKTPSHIKANIEKGGNYVPPTEALEKIAGKILEAQKDVSHH